VPPPRKDYGDDEPTIGRPRKPVDPDIVFKLASIGCTQREIGAWFGVDETTIRYRFTEIYERGKENGKTSLRRMQWKRARAGSDPMLIHLGKHYLGQSERSADSGDDDIIEELRKESDVEQALRQKRESGKQGMAERPPESDI
jgi:hypothetical protein